MNKKIALVTGASSGIGEATAIALQKSGYEVYAGARRLDRMEHLKTLGIHPVLLDVTDDVSMQNVVISIQKEAGRIDVLVNNAGYGSYGAIEDVSMAEAQRQMDVNLFGLVRMIQLVLPRMRKQRSGKIINVTSIGGKIATPFGGWYHASKFAVEGLSDSLRNEVKQFGIDVIVIEPGGIRSEWGEIALENMRKASLNSAYATLAEKTIKAFSNTVDRNPEPSLIGDLIVKAVTSKNPNPRYLGGYMTWIVNLRKLISDRQFDKLIMSQLR